MTELKTETAASIRELAAEDMQAVAGGAFVWTNPGVIRGFNPQPDPPAVQLASPQLGA